MEQKTGLEGLAEENQVWLQFDPGFGADEPHGGSFWKQFDPYVYPSWLFNVQGSKNNGLLFVRKDFTPHPLLQDCFGLASTSFTASMCQMDGAVVMVFQRLLRLQGGVKGCFCCCLGQEMTIGVPVRREIASISEDWTIWDTSLTIYDAKGIPMLKVTGPTLPSYWSGVISTEVFKVKTVAGTVVGEIWAEHDIIRVTFPVNLDVHIKGCLIGCAILVAFMFDFRGCAKNCDQLLKRCVSDLQRNTTAGV
ncbi:phospholipid scramblase 1-like [Ornithodoros turicata]|uniref:phospholipid scramblase 1-like n=1 Tax=Ornithodoros turicata TaxID=34597 RepID=UPI003138E9F6